MKPTNREFEIVYSREEMESKLEQFKMRGFNESDIHVLARDNDVIGPVGSQTDIQTHKAESAGSKFKSFFTGEDSVRDELKKLELDESAIDRYQSDIETGAILLYTDREAYNRDNENLSSFGDDTRAIDVDEQKKNTAFAPFGRDIERDGRRHNDEKIQDKDVRADVNRADRDDNEIYATGVSREEQHGEPGYRDKLKDSRLDGAQIHPTGDNTPKNEAAPAEKEMEHEPRLGTEEGEENLNREEGVNRRQDEPSPGVDPNLGPAPFGRDSEEEHLINRERDGIERNNRDLSGMQEDQTEPGRTSRDGRPISGEKDDRDSTPPSPRLF